MNKRTILLSIIGIIAMISIAIYVNYLGSLQKVTITFDTTANTKLDIYAQKPGSDSPTKTGQILRTLAISGDTFTLQKGVYVIESSGENIALNPVALSVEDAPVMETIPISYTASYLNQLLQKDQEAIGQSIARELPDVLSLYGIEPGQLYRKGDWYTTTLTYRGADTSNRDSLHIVLYRENKIWKILTKPQISLSTVEYPTIPSDIIKAANQYKAKPSNPPVSSPPTFFIDPNAQGAR